VKRIVFWIVAGRDPADDFAATPGQKKFGFPVFEKRMLLAIEEFFALDQQGRDPGRIVLVNPPGKFDECVAIGTRADLRDFDFSHAVMLA
jgi:hypothetical protein